MFFQLPLYCAGIEQKRGKSQKHNYRSMHLKKSVFVYCYIIFISSAISIVNTNGLIAGEIEKNNEENNLDNVKKDNFINFTNSDIWNLHFQMTTISQYHPSFYAQYSGQNSFKTKPELATTVTSTLFAGLR